MPRTPGIAKGKKAIQKPARRTSAKPKVKFLIIISIATLLCLLTVWQVLIAPMDSAENKQTLLFSITSNTTTRKIAEDLKEAGLIRSQMAFLLYAQFREPERTLKAGDYWLSTDMKIEEILGIVRDGQGAAIRVTIPEGFTLAQIAQTLEEKQLIDPGKFYQVISNGRFDYAFLTGLPAGDRRLEGFLFPATYPIKPGMSEHEIVDLMLKTFDKQVTLEMRQQAESKGLTILALITQASIIEKEARIDTERPLIAGVINNRLAQNMLLQMDATIQYALGEHRERVSYQDLEVDSPYNTYRNKGLPPGPIASPGLASIEAVLNPTVHDYLYYVAKADGSHVFTRTLAEHNRAKQQNR